ncbi:hypothetical protein TNCV_1228261 [Trichonephila clavipes]|nr:hypothetical protein TNCV_1228261 [Trichonephila clavipes]
MMVGGAIGYTSRSPLVRLDGTLNSASYISVAYSLFESFEIRLSRIMHDCMLPVLYGPFLIRKMFDFALVCTFTRSFTNGKRSVYGCRMTGSSPYASHYN